MTETMTLSPVRLVSPLRRLPPMGSVPPLRRSIRRGSITPATIPIPWIIVRSVIRPVRVAAVIAIIPGIRIPPVTARPISDAYPVRPRVTTSHQKTHQYHGKDPRQSKKSRPNRKRVHGKTPRNETPRWTTGFEEKSWRPARRHAAGSLKLHPITSHS